MNVSLKLYVGNTSLLAVGGIRSANSGSYQTDAVVTLESLTDKRTGEAVSGITTPLALSYVVDYTAVLDEDGNPLFETDGNYMGAIPADAGLVAGELYKLVINAVSAAGAIGEWKGTALAEDRGFTAA